MYAIMRLQKAKDTNMVSDPSVRSPLEYSFRFIGYVYKGRLNPLPGNRANCLILRLLQ